MKLNKKKIKNLALDSKLNAKQTKEIAGGITTLPTWGACSAGCNSDLMLGCNSIQAQCFSADPRVCA